MANLLQNMRLASKSKPDTRLIEQESLDDSLTLEGQRDKFTNDRDELIVFGDKEIENDESSMINSNLLKLLDKQDSDVDQDNYDKSEKVLDKFNPYSPTKQFLTRMSNRNENKQLGPIRIMKPASTFTNMPESKNPDIGDHGKNFKTATALPSSRIMNTNTKSSRPGSKDVSRKKSSSTRKSRRPSKDSSMQAPENPLKNTLANVMSRFPNSESSGVKISVNQGSPVSNKYLSNDTGQYTLENSPRCPRMQNLMNKQYKNPRSVLMQGNTNSSSPQNHDLFRVALEASKADRSENDQNLKFCDIVKDIKCAKAESNDGIKFDSRRNTNGQNTRGAPKTSDYENDNSTGLMSDFNIADSSNTSKQPTVASGGIEKVPSLGGQQKTKHNHRSDAYKIFTLSQVFSRSAKGGNQ